jgi:ubiquinone/menaquinone biosynthesis C-methylase UbiE
MVMSILNALGDRFTLDAEFISEVINSLSIDRDSIILDIGTGWGKMAIILALHGYNVITGEPNKWSDWEISAKQAGVFEKIHYQPLDAQNLEFEDESVDFIFLLGSLHHIPDKERAILEFLRVLKLRGRILLFDYTKKRIEQIKKRMDHHPPAVNPMVILNKLSVNFNKMIDIKEEIFCYIISKEKLILHDS